MWEMEGGGRRNGSGYICVERVSWNEMRAQSALRTNMPRRGQNNSNTRPDEESKLMYNYSPYYDRFLGSLQPIIMSFPSGHETGVQWHMPHT